MVHSEAISRAFVICLTEDYQTHTFISNDNNGAVQYFTALHCHNDKNKELEPRLFLFLVFNFFIIIIANTIITRLNKQKNYVLVRRADDELRCQ